MTASTTLIDMRSCRDRTLLHFKGERLLDALNFGFSYIESEDHLVEYVAVNAHMAKRVLGEIQDSTVEPVQGFIGRLWTAQLLVSTWLKDDQILFSNTTFSAVVDVKLNPNSDEE